MKSRIWQRMILGCALIAALLQTGCEKASKNSAVNIAVVAPITGKYSDFGQDIVNGVRLAVDEVNSKGGINGRQIQLIVEDEKSGENEAVAAAHLVAGKTDVVGVIGHGSSGATLAASSVYNDNNLALVVPAATNPKITQQGFKNIFRVPITDDLQGPAILDFVLDQLHASKIVIVHNKGAYGEGIANEFQKALHARGLTELTLEGVNPDDKDFRAVLTTIKTLSPEVIFYGGEHPDAAVLLRQAREVGLTARFVMGDGCFSPELIALGGAATEDSIVSNIAPLDSPSPEAAKFYTTFLAKHGKIVAFAPLAYEAAGILMDAVSKAKEPTREGVLKALQSPSYTYTGILGITQFSANGDSKGRKVFFHVVKDGKFAIYHPE